MSFYLKSILTLERFGHSINVWIVQVLHRKKNPTQPPPKSNLIKGIILIILVLPNNIVNSAEIPHLSTNRRAKKQLHNM